MLRCNKFSIPVFQKASTNDFQHLNSMLSLAPVVKVTFQKLMYNWLRKTNLPLILIKKCFEMRENEQKVVLNESSEAFRNRLVIVRILILAMTTAGDDASGSNFVA